MDDTRNPAASPTSTASTAPPPAPEGLCEPLPPACRTRLRRAVVEHARLPGRRHRPRLHVGEPGGRVQVLELDAPEPTDLGLRTDLVATLIDTARRAGTQEPLVWLTRSGDLGDQDVDTGWLAAARAACLESDRLLTMVVVTRRGWRDPRSGLTRTWVRLRLTST